MCGQRHTLAILPPEIPATLCIGGPVWTDAENLPPPTGIRSPDRPACSESLYQLSYAGPHDIFCNSINLKSSIESCYINKYNFGVCLLTDNRDYMLQLKISHYLVTSKYLYTSAHTAYNAFKMSMSTLWPFVNQNIMYILSSEFCILCEPLMYLFTSFNYKSNVLL